MKMTSHYKKYLATADDMLEFASHFAKAVDTNVIIYLHGPLGAGKTTFTRGFLRGLGYDGKVKSPTYTLVESYHIADKILFHCDFYRLNDSRELEYIGIQEYFMVRAICLIEWPEKGSPFLPDADLACYITFDEQGRKIRLVAKTIKGEQIIKRL